MKVTKGANPPAIERPVQIEISREEVLTVLINSIRSKLGPNFKLDDLSVVGDEDGKLQTVSLSGVEIIPITWKSDVPTVSVVPVTPPAPAVTPTVTPAK